MRKAINGLVAMVEGELELDPFSANLYSLIETAKANGIEPYGYLRTVFTELPNATSVEAIEALLPVPADDINVAKVS